ncbi:MAG: DUF4394 domain-containing protein [Saprospiraceae bacterium]|nr:DUF4394 domain-containing protein [Saprospiraceae bacterium]
MSNLHCVRLPLPVRHFYGLTIALLFVFGIIQQTNAQKIYAVSGNNLVAFDAAAPAVMLGSKPVTGISAGQNISGLDFRPNTGELYALGYNQMTGEARLYTLHLNTGAATAVGAAPVFLKAGLNKVGMDFNPTVDRIRVTGSDNSNYRLHPVTGAIAATDLNLAFAATDVNAAADPSVGAVAYTNSYIGATSTTLYNYDDSLNVFTTQIPPNNGTLNTVGASGVQVNLSDPSADIDIYFDATAGANRAFFAANTGTDVADNLYSVNLMSGAATLIGSTGLALSDIAVLIDRSIPANLTGQLVYALSGNGNLLSFDSGLPGVIRNIAPVSGIATGQTPAGMDVRPATGELYALGYNATTGEARLYVINPASGVATAIGSAPVTLKTGMGKIGMDFNPTVDRIRVVGSDNSNYRLHPVTGAVAATDMNLAFAAADVNAGKNPSVGAAAYTNSFNGATATTLYNYDDSLNVFTTQVPPNNGTLNTVGASGITVNLSDPSSDLDIFYNPFTVSNKAYFSANTGSSAGDLLYSVDLGSGLASAIGRIGNGIAVNDIAVAVQPQETACDVKTVNCMKYEVLSVRKDALGNKTYRIRVTNNCSEGLFYTAFQLPKGIVADGPGNNSVYTSPGGHSYEVRNPNFSPFYSVRFKEQGSAGIANGQVDIFEYTLPAVANPNYIHVISRTGTQTYHETYLNVFNCTVGNAPQPLSEPESDDRSTRDIQGELRVYPNPTDGILFVELPVSEELTVHIRVFNQLGQTALDYETQNSGREQINLPAGLGNGLYFIEFSNGGGWKEVRKIFLQR